MNGDIPDVGKLVHVGGPGRECAPAIVLRPGPSLSLVRVLRPTRHTALPGSYDEEGDVRNWRDTQWVLTPANHDPDEPYHPDTWRALDTWHYLYECREPSLITYSPPPP